MAFSALAGCARSVVAPDASPAASAKQTPVDVTFDVPGAVAYRFDRLITLPGAQLSNPSGLAFGGRLEDGRLLFWTVCDGSSIVKDGFDPRRTVVKLRIDPTGARPPEVEPITLDEKVSLCDLESIEIDPADGGLIVADERVPREPACGGTGPNGEARSRLFKVAVDGRLLGGPWEVDVVNDDNNGVEALAVRREPDGTHVFVFEERKAARPPIVLEYRLTADVPAKLEPIRRFQLERGADPTQTAAGFRDSDGMLLVADRDRAELVEVDLKACAGRERVDCLRTAALRPLLQEHLKLETTDGGLHRFGLVEGLATDDRSDLYLVLDNNGQPYLDGDRSPRLIRLIRIAP